MGCACSQGVLGSFREELWSFFALSGILCVDAGIVLLVFALKRATLYPTVVKSLGIGMIIAGLLSIFVSWYVHRQQKRREKVCWLRLCRMCCRCPCCRPGRKREMKSLGRVTPAQGPQKDEVHGSQSSTTFPATDFQRYEEFVKNDTKGVECKVGPREPKRFTMEASNRKHVNPDRSLNQSNHVEAVGSQGDQETTLQRKSIQVSSDQVGDMETEFKQKNQRCKDEQRAKKGVI